MSEKIIEKIIIPESSQEGSDLYDGFILNMYEYEGGINFQKIDKDTLSNIYARLLHYADVMKYENQPGEDPWKYTEAQDLPKKLGGYISEDEFRDMAEKCEFWLAR